MRRIRWGMFRVTWLLVCVILLVHSDARTTSAAEKPSSFEGTTNWEDLNYYQLLGLDSKRDRHVEDIIIKKAYRAQAKRFHPDKMTVTQNTTKEAINARFAKIAEAYQVLSDPIKREEYDRYLRHDERMKEYESPGRRRDASDAGDMADSFFQSWFRSDEPFDAFAIFDMVFGSDKSSSSGSAFDASSLFAEMARKFDGQQEFRSHHSQPIRTTQDQTEFVDAYGQVVVRIRQTEDYADSYQRVLVQDFVEDWDPYQRQWVLVPLQPQPIVVEETGPSTNHDSSRSHQQQGHASSPQWLWPGAMLTVGMALENAPYQARLTPTCEFIVTRASEDENDAVEVHWSSGVAIPVSRRPECGVWLEGRQVVVATLGMTPQVVWHGPHANDDDDANDIFMDDLSAVHGARLDDDGYLSVYRLEDPHEFWNGAIELTNAFPPVVRRVVAKAGGLSFDAMSHGLVRTVCVSSTSPIGCFRIGRLLVRLSRRVKRMVERLVGFVMM